MWRITFHAVPKPVSTEFEKSGGAYVNCWILFAWEDGAEHLARYEVEKELTIIETEEVSWIEASDFSEDDPDKEYFDQALIDGGTFVYHIYPLDADPGDEDFELENTMVSSDKPLANNN
jgi:hypothetical protein